MKRLLFVTLMLAATCARADYFGDFILGDTITYEYNTLKASDGSDLQRTVAGTPSCIPNGSTTEITAGVSDTGTTAFDSSTGLNKMTVVATSGNGFAAGTDYVCTVRASTLNAVTTSYTVFSFSIENRPPYRNYIKTRGLATADDSTPGKVCFTTNIVINDGDFVGMILWNVTKNEKYVIQSSVGSTDCVNIVPNVHTTESLNDVLYVLNDTPTFVIDVQGGATAALAAYFNGTPTATGGTNLLTFINNAGVSSSWKLSDESAMNGKIGTPAITLASDIANVPNTVVENNGSVSMRCALSMILSSLAGAWSQSGSTITFKDPSNTSTRIVGTLTSTSRSATTLTCPP